MAIDTQDKSALDDAFVRVEIFESGKKRSWVIFCIACENRPDSSEVNAMHFFWQKSCLKYIETYELHIHETSRRSMSFR